MCGHAVEADALLGCGQDGEQGEDDAAVPARSYDPRAFDAGAEDGWPGLFSVWSAFQQAGDPSELIQKL